MVIIIISPYGKLFPISQYRFLVRYSALSRKSLRNDLARMIRSGFYFVTVSSQLEFIICSPILMLIFGSYIIIFFDFV